MGDESSRVWSDLAQDCRSTGWVARRVRPKRRLSSPAPRPNARAKSHVSARRATSAREEPRQRAKSHVSARRAT
eukprot:3317228-Rhodomonas_salina.1